jgi:hypothetical protein
MEWTAIPCKKAAELMVAREDRQLELGERGVLTFHLALCKACSRFEHQMLTMRQAMDSWRAYREAEPGDDVSATVVNPSPDKSK